jgi:hypothetical protein
VKWFTFLAKSSSRDFQNAAIARDALENLSGIDVVSVGPVFGEQAEDGVRFSLVTIVPNRGGNDFVTSRRV